ncbi:MAG TPA: MerR family transcriptional regulator [Ktedonobacteraceae bacterium]|nr:MerR family transcriptional regulator [Ktedonobacteraceae bacterium]
MYERSLQSIREHLQKEDAQGRILQNIQRGRAEATVTISRAAELFEFTENKLRDWEKYGFLNPLRPVGSMGRRLYTLRELDKLAIIRELIDAGYAPSDIPPDIDQLWQSLSFPEQVLRNSERERSTIIQYDSMDGFPINLRIERARQEAAWRYFASRALRLSLLLVSEDRPNTAAGLLLPLDIGMTKPALKRAEDISMLGETLVGWLDQAHSSYTFLTTTPSFEYSTDYRVHALQTMKSGVVQDALPQDPTLIVVPRETRQLTLGSDVVETIRTLLQPLYEESASVKQCFGHGMHDLLEPATDLGSSAMHEDGILNGLAEIVVRLGGLTTEGHERWRFCCILLPNHPTSILPLQQRSLVVRAQSKHSPHQIGSTMVAPQSPVIGLCLSAFQSGHIIYLPDVSHVDATIAARKAEEPVRSAIAIPVENVDNVSIGVIYAVSEYPDAFAKNEQRVMRMVGKMVGELLETYQLRLEAVGRLRDLIAYPEHVDMLFKEFLSENEFIRDIEALLLEGQSREDELKEVVSFIAVDIDNQSSIANKYGDRMAGELARLVGLRIHGQLRALKDNAAYELYHINADRYYIILKGLGLEQARSKGEQLRQALAGSYQIDPMRDPAGQPALPENMLSFTNISARLGVACYFYWKLKEVLLRFAPETAVVEFRMQIIGFLEEELNLGKREGGNVVMSWDPKTRGFVRLAPEK